MEKTRPRSVKKNFGKRMQWARSNLQENLAERDWIGPKNWWGEGVAADERQDPKGKGHKKGKRNHEWKAGKKTKLGEGAQIRGSVGEGIVM